MDSIHHKRSDCFVLYDGRYAYSTDEGEEFDRDENTLTLIKPSPITSKDVHFATDARALHAEGGQLEEDKAE